MFFGIGKVFCVVNLVPLQPFQAQDIHGDYSLRDIKQLVFIAQFGFAVGNGGIFFCHGLKESVGQFVDADEFSRRFKCLFVGGAVYKFAVCSSARNIGLGTWSPG